MGNLSNLESLYLSSNELTGCIPEGLRDVANNDFQILGLDFCEVDSSDPLIVRYDANNNGTIEKIEVIAAINDYLFGAGDEAISKSDVIKLINLVPSAPYHRPSSQAASPAAREGTVASSRAAISSLVSFSLGLDRPSSEFLLVMFPPCLSFPRFGSRNPLCQLGGVQVFTNRLQVRTTAVTSMFTVPPSGRSAPSFRDPQETRDLLDRADAVGVLHAPPHWKTIQDAEGRNVEGY